MIRDLNSILDHIDTLNELDTSDVPPLAEVVRKSRRVRLTSCWRSGCCFMASEKLI